MSGYDWSSVGSHTYAWVRGWHGMDSTCSLLPKTGNCFWHWAESSAHAFRFQLSAGLVEGWALVTHLIRRLSNMIYMHCSTLSIWTALVYFQYHACLAWITAEVRPVYLLLPAYIKQLQNWREVLGTEIQAGLCGGKRATALPVLLLLCLLGTACVLDHMMSN